MTLRLSVSSESSLQRAAGENHLIRLTSCLFIAAVTLLRHRWLGLHYTNQYLSRTRDDIKMYFHTVPEGGRREEDSNQLVCCCNEK